MEFDRLARNGGLQGKHVLMYAVEAKLEALCIKMVEKGADVNATYVSSVTSSIFSLYSRTSGLQCRVTDSFALISGLIWVFNRW